METKIVHTELIERRQRLDQAAQRLKAQFVGLDDIIDEVISLMTPWFLFPYAQLRPTVINLWGLTGSGKTALVKAIVEILDHRKLYSQIDMGEFESDSASWIKEIFTDDLAFFHEKPVILCLDEFQFANTINANGSELGKDKLRVIWDVLDSGRIEYIPGDSTYYLFRAENCLKRLKKLVTQGVVIENGVIVQGAEVFKTTMEGFFFDYNDRNDSELTVSYFLSDDFINGMFNLFEDDAYSREQVRTLVKSVSMQELMQLVKRGMHTRPATKTLDLSRSLIFVLGNLDEAYSMSHNMNPDISADDFHEATSKITIADVKKALRKRFRPEQIARLGNNQIIYRSFNNAQFRILIRRELDRIGAFVSESFGWRIHFDESVVDIVYAEGVFPAQGTRPVLTTVKNLVESKVSNLVVSVLQYPMPVHEIHWKYADTVFTYDVKDAQGITMMSIADTAKLRLENLRKSVDPQIQAHVAVHEAGHAVLAALTLKILPSMVVSRTASDVEGFCMVNFPKGPMTRESLKKDIIITLGGYVAEKMIFGEEFTCAGVSNDIEHASRLANQAIRDYAMGSDPIHLSIQTAQNPDAFELTQKHTVEAMQLINTCEIEAERILVRNKRLLLKMAEYLTVNSRMEEKGIEACVKAYAVEEWVQTHGFIGKDDYYRFDATLREQLRQADAGQLLIEVETLMSDMKEESLI